MADLTVSGPTKSSAEVGVVTTDPSQPVVLTTDSVSAAAVDTSTDSSPPNTNSEQQQSVEQLEQDAGDGKVRTKFRIYATLGALYLVVFVVALDQTVVATAIPTICEDLGSAAGYTWIGAAYLLGGAATGPIWAKLSDIWGRKLILLTAVVIFAGASLIAALSVSMAMLIAARGLEGIAGGGLGSLVAITISDMFSIRERSLYLGFMGGIWAVAGSAGPVVGGVFTELVTWRWCFWLNLPVCGSSFALLLFCLDVHNPRTPLRKGLKVVDWFGTVSILAITILILLGLDFGGETFPWSSAKVICLLVFGGLMIGVFIFGEKRVAKYPLIPLGMFGTLPNNAVILVAVGHSIVASGVEYYLPLFFQSVRGASPLRSGVLVLPQTLTAAATDLIGGVLIHRTGRYKEFIWAGVFLMTLGTGLYIDFWVHTPLARIIGIEIIGAAGVALLFQTPMIAIQNVVKQADVASSTAALSFLRSLATSLSIVIGSVVFQNSMSSKHSALAAAGLSDSVLSALSGSEAAAHVHISQRVPAGPQRQAILEAFAGSLRNMWILYTSFGAVTVIASLFIKQRKMSEEHTETKTGIEHLSKREPDSNETPEH